MAPAAPEVPESLRARLARLSAMAPSAPEVPESMDAALQRLHAMMPAPPDPEAIMSRLQQLSPADAASALSAASSAAARVARLSESATSAMAMAPSEAFLRVITLADLRAAALGSPAPPDPPAASPPVVLVRGPASLGHELPTELNWRVLTMLDLPTVCTMSLTSRQWRQTADNELLWRALYVRRFGFSDMPLREFSWKEWTLCRRDMWRALERVHLRFRSAPMLDAEGRHMPPFVRHVEGSDRLAVEYFHEAAALRGLPRSRTCGSVMSSEPLVPIPTTAPVYVAYFEVTVVRAGVDGAIGVGVSREGFCELNGHPGWRTRDVVSYGWHGDDGKKFPGREDTQLVWRGEPYGPTFGEGDVVGCGLNFGSGHLFFTLNGTKLPVAFHHLADVENYHEVFLEPYYAVAGLHSAGEQVRFNFGREPFVYCIDQHIAEQATLARIDSCDSLASPVESRRYF